MGDIIYPGLLIKRAHPDPNPQLLKEFLKAYLKGEDDDIYEDGEPKIQVFHFKDTSSRILLTGIKLPFNEIRVALGRNLFMSRPIFIQTPDFGIPRDAKGSIIDHTMLDLHNRLRQGQGNLGVMDVFQVPFREQLGNIEELSSKIYYGDVKRFIRTFMLKEAGKLLLYGNVPGRIESSSEFNDRAHHRTTTSTNEGLKVTEIEYVYTMEALQAICLLNQNKKFSLRHPVAYDQLSFITSSDNFLCKVTGNYGLGKSGKTLDVKGTLLLNQGFIPFHLLNEKVFSMTKINGFGGQCFACSSPYNVIGISPDLNWLAGTCSCAAFESYCSWHNDDYFRLFIPPRQLELYNKYGSSQGGRFQKVQKLIRGVLPKYDNVFHFKSTALAAYETQCMFDIEQMHVQQCAATLIQYSLIETIVKKTCKTDRLKIVLRVKKTGLWSEEGTCQIGKAILVPNFENLGKEKIENPISYVESKSGKHFVAVLYEITMDPLDACYSKVFLTTMVPHGQVIPNTYTIIPRPPTSAEKGVNRAVAKWIKYENEKLMDQTIINGLTVHSSNGLTTHKINNEMDATPINIVVENNPAWKLIKDCLINHYVGVDVKCDVQLPNEMKKIVAKGRIVAVCQQMVSACKANNSSFQNPLDICVVVSLPIESQIIINSKSLLKLWILYENRTEEYAHDEYDGYNHLLKGDDYGPSMMNPPLFEGNDRMISQILEYDPKLVATYEVKHVQPGNLSTMAQIVESWRHRPAYKFPLLDFLTESSLPLKFDKLYVCGKGHVFRKENAYGVLSKTLNESQRKSVITMLQNKLSATRGAPGTGKTKTAVTGVAMLHCLENGLIIYSCPTNEGVDVAYQTLVETNILNRMEMSIIKMQSHSREQQDLRNVKCLHNLEAAKLGNYSLTLNEYEALDSHIFKIASDILLLADVVFCTTACLNDFRVEFLLTDLQKEGRQFSALIIDEASLISVPSTIPSLVLNPKRLWLVGDDLQLRQVVKDYSAANACLDISFMEILQLRNDINENGLFNILDIQYRMASLPASVVSEYTYNGQIVSSDCVKTRDYSNHPVCIEFPEMAQRNLAVYTYNIKSDQLDSSAMSYYNEKEIEITKAILMRLRNAGVELSNVCLLSFYDAHVRRLKQMTQDHMLENVKVQTIDSYQGRQSPIIILNMVRSNSENSVGFVRDGRRLNVAFSRMEDFLFVVGDLQMLKKSEVTTLTKLLRVLSLKTFKLVLFKSSSHGISQFADPVNLHTYYEEL
ncbi:unnamed protein product [Orchesella dallaii]|uniref:Uncharacterized protein n=1 Tax=Orchesella dallaii TaxID=48710 RepID=A0ABP1PYZ9_9HEXA